VVPHYVPLAPEKDPRDFIISENIQRRHLTKGQQAMAVALIFPEGDERGRGKKGKTTKSAEAADFSATRLRQARAVLHHSRPLAQSVLKGAGRHSG
jgi:hypothetical protein